jgi:uncharacterized protein (TIRG00374 family)
MTPEDRRDREGLAPALAIARPPARQRWPSTPPARLAPALEEDGRFHGPAAYDGRSGRPQSGRVRSVALRTAAGLAVGAVLIVAFLRLADISAILHRLTHLSLGLAAACGAVYLTAYVVRGMRWRCLLRPDRVSIARAAAIYQVGIFLNWLLPVRGGEIAMSLLLRRSNGIPVNRSLAAVTMDKAMDLVPSVALFALIPFLGLHVSGPLWVLMAGALAVTGFGAVVLALAAWRRDQAVALLAWPARAMAPRRGDAIASFIAGFIDTLLGLIRRPRQLLVAGGYTAVALVLDAVFCLLAFRAIGVAIPFPVAMYGYMLFNLSFIMPSPPGQVGSNEVVGLLVFSGLFGVARSGVGAMFLFSHPWTSLLMTCSGLACLSAMGLTVRGTLRLAREPSERERS